MYRRQQNRESATRTRKRKENYIQELEQQIQILTKENQDYKIANATLSTENAMLKKQVAYYEGIMAPKIQHEERLNLDDGKDLLIGKECDSDYGFWGSTIERESDYSPKALTLSIVFGILCFTSMIFTPHSSDASANGNLDTGHNLKSLHETEFGWWSIGKYILNPYALLFFYIFLMLLLVLRSEKSWIKTKYSEIKRLIKFHSKSS